MVLLGINEIGAEKHGRFDHHEDLDEYRAIHKLETYGKLIGYPVVLFGVIYTYIQLQAMAVALTAFGSITLIAALIAYQKYGKPCPNDHFALTNLSLEILRSDELIYERQDILRAIERAFNERKGVILVGEPGAGKSSISRSLAERIADGKSSSLIQNCQVFSCGASKFTSPSFDSASLDSITERFKDYREQVIFFFDEFHAFFQSNKMDNQSKVDDVKMFCENFKFVVGATTTKEYEKFIKKQQAIVDRRFIVVKVGKLDDKKIKSILSQYLQTKYPTIKLDVKTLDYIVKKATAFNPKTSKIDAAQSLLNRAIKELDIVEFKTLELQIDQLEAEKKLIEQSLFQVKMGQEASLTKKLKDKQAKIDQLKMQLKKKNQQVNRIKKIEAYYLKLKEQSFRLADPAVNLSTNVLLEREWIELQVKIKRTSDFIDKEKVKLHLPTGLNCLLIDKIIKDRKT